MMTSLKKLSPVVAAGIAMLLAGQLAPHAVATPVDVRYVQAIPNDAPLRDLCGVPHNEFEAQVAVDPLNPDNVLAAWIQDDQAAVVAARSIDGGRSWSLVPIDGTNACGADAGPYIKFVDQWLSFGFTADGGSVAYLVLHALTADLTRQDILVVTTRDAGRTWSLPRVVSSGAAGEYPDKASIAAHPTEPCVAYAVWRRGNVGSAGESPATLARTSDCGDTWSPPRDLLTPDPAFAPVGSLILTHPGGPVLHVFGMFHKTSMQAEASGIPVDPTPVPIMIQRTEDGNQWSEPMEIGRAVRPSLFDPDGRQVPGAYAFPTAAVSADGTAYVAWPDNEGSVLLVESSDAGRTWTAPAPVVTQRRGVAFPTLAVAGRTVGVTYYDFRTDESGDDKLTTEVWFSHADHGGKPKWDETKLAGPFDARNRFLGDYQGLAGFRGGFVAAFVMPAQTEDGTTDVFAARLESPPR